MSRTVALRGAFLPRPRPAPASNKNLLSLKRHAAFGMGTVVALLLGIGGWSITTRVDSAVIANGVVTTEGGSRKVQHLEGGIVGKILVTDNQEVEAGQVLLTLDDVAVRSELEVTLGQLRENLATQARLTAESSGDSVMQLPTAVGDWPLDPKLSVNMADQQRLKASREKLIDDQVERFSKLVDEKQALIKGYEAQLTANKAQLVVYQQELDQLSALFGKSLVSNERLNEVKRNVADMAGQITTVQASITGTESSIIELKMQSDQVISDFRADALTQLQTVSQKVSELLQRKIEAESRLHRLEIRAPISGTVNNLTVHTVGGVVAPGDVLMLIVPKEDHLLLDVRASPVEISKLHVGQAAEVKFLSPDIRTSSDLVGSVKTISPDLLQDPRTGAQYYSVRVDVADRELGKLRSGASLVPGMPAETFFKTGERTVWSYLVGPIEERFSHALREN